MTSAGVMRYFGPLLVVLSCLAFTLMDATAQSCMRHGLGPGQVGLSRMVITLPIIATYIWIRTPSYFSQLDPRRSSHQPVDTPDDDVPKSDHRTARLIWLRSALISIAVCLGFASMNRIAISEFITVFSPRAFLIGFLCWALLREAFGWRLRIAAVCSVIAVTLVVQPPFIFGTISDSVPGRRAAGFFFAFACMLLDATEMFVLRYLGPNQDPLTMTLAYAMTCLVLCPLYMLFSFERPVFITESVLYLKLFILAMLGLIAQMSVVTALQTESGATVSVISYAQIPMSVLVQSTILGELPNTLQIIGGCIILISGTWAIMAENKESEREEAAETEGYALLSADIEPAGVHD